MLTNFLNKQGTQISRSQQDAVLELVQHNDRSVTVVDMGKDVDDEFVDALCRALVTNRFVTTLRIRDKRIAPSIDALAALCSRTSTLVNLKISHAELDDDDAACLLAALLGNKSIMTLGLDHNKMTAPDAVVMLLSHNKYLESLDLSFNMLGGGRDKNMAQIADALAGNTTLKQLYLSGNGMSDAGARRFVSVIDQNVQHGKNSLRVLDIAAENSVRSETKQALKLVLEAGRQQASNRTHVGDDLRSQLDGIATQSNGGHTARTTAMRDEPLPSGGLTTEDMHAWQEQVEASNARFDDERKELLARIDGLKTEKDNLSQQHITALEAQNKLQSQIVVANERNAALQRDLDALSARYERKVKESGEQVSSLQSQISSVRKELLRVQEASAADRATLVRTQDELTSELSQLHAQLAAATRANDLYDRDVVVDPKPVCVSIGTDTEGLTVPPRAAAQPAGHQSHTGQHSQGHMHHSNSHHSGASANTSGQGLPARRGSSDSLGWSSKESSVPETTRSDATMRAAPAPPRVSRELWLDDASARDCAACRKEFSLTRRKHHCRVCGRVFCGGCCSEFKPWGMRTCTFCLATHGGM